MQQTPFGCYAYDCENQLVLTCAHAVLFGNAVGDVNQGTGDVAVMDKKKNGGDSLTLVFVNRICPQFLLSLPTKAAKTKGEK